MNKIIYLNYHLKKFYTNQDSDYDIYNYKTKLFFNLKSKKSL